MYRHVDVLRSAGHAASIVHHRPGFRAPWFAGKAPVLYAPVDIRPDDILVFPEIEFSAMLAAPSGVRRVAYVQTPYYMFREHSWDPRDRRTPYLSGDLVAAVVVSEDGRDYLAHAFANLPVYRVRNSIDLRFGPPGGSKKKQLCFMPRKHYEDAQQVLNILKFRNVLDGWAVVPIHNLPEEQVISTMRDSAVFLSFGYPEGFGLPPAEAMASGCVVVGYHGNGGREYFTADHGFPVEIGDILGFARAAEHVISTLDANFSAFNEMTARASSFIRSTYTPVNEREDVLNCWTSILATRC